MILSFSRHVSWIIASFSHHVFWITHFQTTFLGLLQVIDIMEHPYYPVSPNAVDPVSRQTATFATLLSILTRSGGDALLLDIDQTHARRFINYLKSFVYKEQSRVDWVVKILLDQGRDVDFAWVVWRNGPH